jgi:gamma-glutamyltranspeptidase/glutathione hydrolase
MPRFAARAEGSRHMAAAANRLAAQAALHVLEAGGNAVDAGVAGGLTLNVVHCEFTHFAGVAPIMIWLAESGRALTIDGLGGWPAKADPAYFRAHHGGRIPPGIRRSVVPGAPGAWITALERFGTMSFTDVAAPALRFAREGFVVSRLFNHIVSELRAEFARWPANAALFLPGGAPPATGSVFKLPELAATLELLCHAERKAAIGGGRAAGLAAVRDAFYRGDIARAIDDFYRREDGWLSYDDLARHRTIVEPATTARYRTTEILTCGPWCQGPVLGQALAILDHCDLSALAHNSAPYIHVVVETLKLAFADRERWYGDPNFVHVPLAGLLDRDYARERRALIDPGKAIGGMAPAGVPRGAACGDRMTSPDPGARAAVNLDTSFICTADRHGNLFAATPSDGCFGSPMVPGLGLCPSSRGAQSWTDPRHQSVLAPGKRPRLTPSPAIAIRDGRWFMPFGSPGDDLQPQAMLQFLLNQIVFGMDPQAAVEAPRFATLSFPRSFEPHEFIPDRMVAEARIDGDCLQTLRGLGHDPVAWEDWDWRAGCVCAVIRDRETGLLQGAADPRRPAGAMGR